MPRRTYKRKTNRKYTPKKRYGRKRYSRRSKVNVHFFKRTYVETGILYDYNWDRPSTFVPPLYQHTTLALVPNYAELVACYDEYKICGLKKKFVFNRNSASTVTAGMEIPTLVSVNDYNDSGDMLTEAEALQYPTYKASILTRPITRYYRPSIKIEATGGTLGISSKSRWISTGNAVQQHYGFKFAFTSAGNTGLIPLGHVKIYTTVYVACRGPK